MAIPDYPYSTLHGIHDQVAPNDSVTETPDGDDPITPREWRIWHRAYKEGIEWGFDLARKYGDLYKDE